MKLLLLTGFGRSEVGTMLWKL